MLIAHVFTGTLAYSAVAEAIGVTRNAAIGRLYRLQDRFAAHLAGDDGPALEPDAAARAMGLPGEVGELLLGTIISCWGERAL